LTGFRPLIESEVLRPFGRTSLDEFAAALTLLWRLRVLFFSLALLILKDLLAYFRAEVILLFLQVFVQ